MINSNKIDRTVTGNYFEDFTLGQEIVHATPRTVTVGDTSAYTALYGGRFAVQSSDDFAQRIGYPRSPIDDFLVFHFVIGKTVPDISRNAIAISAMRSSASKRPSIRAIPSPRCLR